MNAEGATAIWAGGDTSAARTLGGQTILWGAYFYLEPYEEQIMFFDETALEYRYLDIDSVAMGTFHVLSTDEDGHVYAYGGNSFGQLGSGEAGENAFYYGGWADTGLDLQTGEYTAPSELSDMPDFGQAL